MIPSGGIDWYDKRADLAHIRSTARTPGNPGDPKGPYAWRTWHGIRLAQQEARYRAPAEQDVYVTPGAEWTMATFHYQYDHGETTLALATQVTAPTTYEKGKTYAQDWLSAPFNPELGDGTHVARDGDKLRISLPVFSDAAGHRSEYIPGADSGSTVLTTDDGKEVDHVDRPGQGVFVLPRPDAWYRLTVDAARDGGDPVTWQLGTRVTSTWRFRSAHTLEAVPQRLLDLTYDVPLSGEEAASPTEPLTYSVGVGSQAGTDAKEVASLKVWYATDGTTWQPAETTRATDGRWKVTVPASGVAKVSLSTTVTDVTGASLTETLRDAYNSGCPDIWCS